MFKAFEAIGAAWHAIIFVSEWTGISLGAMAALAALFYFVPLARKFAIAAAVLVVVAWACLMHGHIAGEADEADKLQTISNDDDKNAAAAAAVDDKARAADIEAKAKAQHEQDLAEIERLKAAGADCSFDPDGGLQPSGSGPAKAGAVGNVAKPSPIAKIARKSPAGAAPGQGLHFPLVFGRWLQGKEHHGDASPNGQ